MQPLRAFLCGLLPLGIAWQAGFAPDARAWGTHGHKVVAMIAERHLTASARAETNRLAHADGYQTLDELASWPDDWRHDHRETGPWHYVNIPLASASLDMQRDCASGSCVVAKIAEFAAVLASRDRPDAEREVALKFVVHLVADIHQPLHCEDHKAVQPWRPVSTESDLPHLRCKVNRLLRNRIP